MFQDDSHVKGKILVPLTSSLFGTITHGGGVPIRLTEHCVVLLQLILHLRCVYHFMHSFVREELFLECVFFGYTVSFLKEEIFPPIDGAGVRLSSFQIIWSDSENITRLECMRFDRYNLFPYRTTIVRRSKIPGEDGRKKEWGT